MDKYQFALKIAGTYFSILFDQKGYGCQVNNNSPIKPATNGIKIFPEYGLGIFKAQVASFSFQMSRLQKTECSLPLVICILCSVLCIFLPPKIRRINIDKINPYFDYYLRDAKRLSHNNRCLSCWGFRHPGSRVVRPRLRKC